jgi:AcrR family transcriptional regulator
MTRTRTTPRTVVPAKPSRRRQSSREGDAKQDGPELAESASGKGDKLDIILRVAAQCFSERGFEATSLDEIAFRVGLHKATLYHYIESKHDILYHCLLRSFRDYSSALVQIEDRSIPVLDRLRFFFRNLIYAQNNLYGRCVAAVGTEALGHDPGGRIRAFRRQLDHAVRGLIEEGIAKGEIRKCSAPVVSAIIFGAFTWTVKWHQPGKTLSLDDVCEEFLRIFIDGFAVRPENWTSRGSSVSGRTRRPAAESPDKRAEILLAAAQCFSEQGYEATSLIDIADKVKLNKATLYHYVDSKSTLLLECLQRSFADFNDVSAHAKDETIPPLERLEHFFRHLVQAQNNDFGRCVNLVPTQVLSDEAAAGVQQFQRRMDITARQLIQEGIAKAEIKPIHPVIAAAFLFGATNWVPHWFKPGRGLSLDDIAEEFLRTFLCGIRKR